MNKLTPTLPLISRVITEENERHARRLAAIKKATAKLRQFEPTFTALEKRGIHVALNHLRTDYQGALNLTICNLPGPDCGLYNVLIEIGFNEINSSICGRYTMVTLKKSRLLVSLVIEVDPARFRSTAVHTSALPAAGSR